MRFFIADLIGGGTLGSRWNGWACPYFTKESAEAIVKAWVREYGTFTGVNDEQTGPEQRPCAWFDEEARRFWFYHPHSDDLENYDAHAVDGVEVWSIGAWGWTWEIEQEEEIAS